MLFYLYGDQQQDDINSILPAITVQWTESFSLVQCEAKVSSVEDISLLPLEEKPADMYMYMSVSCYKAAYHRSCFDCLV